MPVRTRLSTTLLGLVVVASLTACGSSGAGSGSPGSTTGSSGTRDVSSAAPVATGRNVSAPCDVTDRATVAAVFPGAAAGKAGPVRNCEYALASGPIKAVNVFLYGSSSQWDAQKAQAEEYAAPLKDVAIGDGAYYALKGGGAVTVRKGSIIFAVQAVPNGFPKAEFFAAHEAQVESLARAVAAQH